MYLLLNQVQFIINNIIIMRGLVYQALSSVQQNIIGPLYRKWGKSLYVLGTKLQGDNASEDRLVPSLRNLTYNGASPNLEGADFIAPNATIVGNVSVGFNSSVWYGATLIGTKGIQIGDNSIIQDRCHVSSDTKIGNDVFVGPNSIIQGAQLADRSFVAMGATVRHAKVESGALVAAGAVIGDSLVVKEGQIWAGNPGKFLRNLTPTQRQILLEHIQQMKDLALVHAQQTQKNSRQVISNKKQPFEATVFEEYLQNIYTDQLQHGQLIVTQIQDEFVQRRTIMRQKIQLPHFSKDYQPYQNNLAHMGEKFNLGIHKESYQKIATKIVKKERFVTDQGPWTKPF